MFSPTIIITILIFFPLRHQSPSQTNSSSCFLFNFLFFFMSSFKTVHTKASEQLLYGLNLRQQTKTNEQQNMLSPTIIITVLIIFSFHQTTSLPPHAPLSTCHNTTFNCGTITNLSYPFTGGDRPSFCGPPQFHLTCNDGVPELNISLASYRVLQVNSVTRTLSLARLDLWNETCTHVYVNTSFDDTSFFSYGSGNQNLTLFYECKPSSAFIQSPANLFHCERNGNKNNSYSLVGPFPLDPILGVVECDQHIEVPVLQEQAERLVRNRSLLREVLMKGFNVNYNNLYDSECFECLGSGGQHCGFDSDNNESICICGDQLCPTPGKSSSSKVPVAIGAGVGAVALVCLIVCVFFFMRRKRKIANKSRSQDLFMPPSSGEAYTSTTNTFETVSSFPSYKSETMPRSFYFGVQVFNYAELQEATKNFDPSRELGEGGFGTVYKGELEDGRVVAVKRLYESNFKRVEQFMNEVEILARLRHKNLVTLFGCTSRHSRELLLVYEFIPNGTVSDHLQGNRSKSSLLPWPVRLNIAVETAEALAYLHASDVIHRDVKSNNILLDDKFQVKVADFGLSRLFPNHVTHVSTAPQGTPGYVDPEYYQCYQLTDKSDVYSFGVVLVELISSLQAVDINRTRNEVNLANMAVNKIQNQELHELVDPSLGFERDHAIRRMTTAVAELAFRCLQQQREMRPPMDEVLEVLRGIKSDELGAKGEAHVVDIRTEEVIPLKKVPSPVSPDSVVDKWVSGSSVSKSS